MRGIKPFHAPIRVSTLIVSRSWVFRGARPALYSSLTRFQKSYAPEGRTFAAHVAFYSPCYIRSLDDEAVVSGELVMEPGPVEVSAGSSSSDIRSSSKIAVTGKTRSIKGKDRAFLSAAKVG